ATYAASFPGTQSVANLAFMASGCGATPPTNINTAPCVVDQFWSSAAGVKSGYTFALTYASDASYLLLADPNSGTSSTRHYGVDQNGTIWYKDGAALAAP